MWTGVDVQALRAVLDVWVRRRTTAQAVVQRSRIVLECAAGRSVMGVSRRLRIAPDTVRTWRRRFPEHGLDRLQAAVIGFGPIGVPPLRSPCSVRGVVPGAGAAIWQLDDPPASPAMLRIALNAGRHRRRT
ncbi:helix-turn-helix domain-containing protein [Streptomyces xanthophaeus]|uniref:helix-turn-helix domain-containing protein n=1 Tax=Streptomyces xanthophaeus TaxID=67385 RepID=UPI00365B22F5